MKREEDRKSREEKNVAVLLEERRERQRFVFSFFDARQNKENSTFFPPLFRPRLRRASSKFGKEFNLSATRYWLREVIDCIN